MSVRLALQHRWHYRPYECTPTDERGTGLRGSLVRSDNVGTTVVGDSCNDIFPAV